jgi:hypothetical protein
VFTRSRLAGCAGLVLASSIWTASSSAAAAAPADGATPAAAPAKPGAATAPAAVPLKQEELDQLLAPIALYPDSLLTQLLMASTYPLEIVQADRWAKANSTLKDKALTTALEKQTWDPSVKSLVNFPQVLTMMSEKLELTIKLGDAFVAQQADVLNTVQKLRAKAQSQGNLKTNEQQKVIVEAPPPAQTTVIVEQVTPPPAQVIKIEPAQPSVVYVPTYSPTVVYGGWPYPAYPPAPYYPPGYVASNMMSFGVGVACGAAWGYAWGNSNWGHGDVDVDINRNTNFNQNINRNNYQGNFSNRQNSFQGGKGSWQHNSAHRGAVPYRDSNTAQRYGGNSAARSTQARNDYRGRTDSGLNSVQNSRAGGSANRGTGVENRGAGAGSGNRASPSASPSASPNASNRGSSSSGSSALSGVDRGGSEARSSSARGQSSRSSSGSSRSSGSGSGGGSSRSGGGGGGSRGGGGGGRR